jgi:Ca-activated chloride channel family protein
MNTEAYARIDENPFQTTQQHPLSTFSADVDTASYANTRRFLKDGQLPPKDAVRLEEFINYFHYDLPPAPAGQPFSITTEVGASPWNTKYDIVRIGLKAPAIDDAKVPPRNLTFLIDVSGSMFSENKLPLLKRALLLLVDQLRPEDKVAMVVYAGNSGLVLPPTSGREKAAIRNALTALEAGGSTNGAAGIELAYETAQKNFVKGGINRVILCTDGDFNVGTTSEGDLTRLIEQKREKGVFLTVLGFGMGNLKDATMEKLADRGNGNYAYIDGIEEARKVLVKEAGATLVTVAKDVKLQVEFNPTQVAGYRLVGYEKRLLKDEDFNDDKKDAGDIGAGHSVTALYEIIPAGQPVPGAKVDALKYTKTSTTPTNSSELMTVKIRYKQPDGKTSKLLEQPVKSAAAPLAQTTTDFRWAVAVAGFGMMLRESPNRGNLSWDQVEKLAEGSVGPDTEGYRRELLQLVKIAAKLHR